MNDNMRLFVIRWMFGIKITVTSNDLAAALEGIGARPGEVALIVHAVEELVRAVNHRANSAR